MLRAIAGGVSPSTETLLLIGFTRNRRRVCIWVADADAVNNRTAALSSGFTQEDTHSPGGDLGPDQGQGPPCIRRGRHGTRRTPRARRAQAPRRAHRPHREPVRVPGLRKPRRQSVHPMEPTRPGSRVRRDEPGPALRGASGEGHPSGGVAGIALRGAGPAPTSKTTRARRSRPRAETDTPHTEAEDAAQADPQAPRPCGQRLWPFAIWACLKNPCEGSSLDDVRSVGENG